MSREQCGNCGHVFSTTNSPNTNDGYFIHEVGMEQLEDLKSDDTMTGRLKACGAIACHQCPRCGMITPK